MRLNLRGTLPTRIAFISVLFAAILAANGAQAIAQDDPNTISREVTEQTITFDAVNPYTKAPGKMTIVFSGVFHLTRSAEDPPSAMSRVNGSEVGTFTFVPEDVSQPTVSGAFRFRLAGQMQPRRNSIDFAFRMAGASPDGTRVIFLQAENVLIKEDGVEITFGETRAVDARDN